MAKEMDENKDQPRKFSTCFDGSSFARMMQMIISEKGIGSLCEEMMRSLGQRGCEGEEEPQEARKKESRGKEK
jgi:hypothetical protein